MSFVERLLTGVDSGALYTSLTQAQDACACAGRAQSSTGVLHIQRIARTGSVSIYLTTASERIPGEATTVDETEYLALAKTKQGVIEIAATHPTITGSSGDREAGALVRSAVLKVDPRALIPQLGDQIYL